MTGTNASRGASRFAALAHRRVTSFLILASLAPFALACGGGDSSAPGDASDDHAEASSITPHGDGGPDSETTDASIDAAADADASSAHDAALDATIDADAAPHADGGTPDDSGTSATCSPNPANYDIPGNGCDDDADGTVDGALGCDSALSVTGDATAFAQAIGLCQTATGPSDPKWGVVSVEYKGSFSTGTPAQPGQHGILPKFGDVVKAREGSALGVLSTGWAREYDTSSSTASTPFKGGAMMQPGNPADDAPPGFPRSGACAVDSTVHDVIDVKLRIKVPANALGVKFDFDFWSGEWPEYVCTKFNDAFIAYLTSTAFNAGTPDNISFDAQKNPISVNNGFFDRCTPSAATGCVQGAVPKTSTCASGEGELAGTGFFDQGTWCAPKQSTGGGATGWLTSTAPVTPGEIITVELMIWDTGDQSYDSSVLLDHFTWLAAPTTTATARAQ